MKLFEAYKFGVGRNMSCPAQIVYMKSTQGWYSGSSQLEWKNIWEADEEVVKTWVAEVGPGITSSFLNNSYFLNTAVVSIYKVSYSNCIAMGFFLKKILSNRPNKGFLF